jgi:beta-mannosidase
VQIGFRVIELEQPPAPNGGFLFRLRVNGVIIHARGSNWVPLNSLPQRPSAARELASLVASVQFANQNILRVWGGGAYAPAALMDAADAAGVLVFHDAMFGDQFYNTQRGFLDDVGAEVRDQLFRLGHHASLAVLCGNNEMAAGYADAHHLPRSAMPFYSALYFDTILANFSSLLPFTPRVSSTPSNGNETRERPWSGSAEIITRGDVHWYNLDGDCLNLSAYPRARWVTEHGWESFPSFLTLAPSLTGPADYAFNSTLVASRQQHPPGQAQITRMVAMNWGWPPRRVPLGQRVARFARLRGEAAQSAAAAGDPAPLAPLLALLRGRGAAASNATAFRDELHMTQVAAGLCLRTALQRWRSFADDFSQAGGGTAGIL